MIVEIVTKSGRVMEIHAFQKDHISIGRGYGNDLILQDPYMDANHLEVTFDRGEGTFVVRDLKSTNGTKAEPPLATLRPCELESFQSGEILTLGKTHIRLIDPSHAAPAALKLSAFEPVFALLSTWRVMLFLLSAIITITITQAYLANPFSEKLLKELNTGVIFLFVALCYGGIWMLAARLQRMEGRLLFNVNILLFLFVVDGTFQLFVAVYDFNIGWLLSTHYFSLVLTFWLVATALFVSSTQTLHLKRWLAGGIAGVLALLSIMTDISAIIFPADFSAHPVYNMTLVEPALQLRGEVSEAEFMLLVEDAFQRAEEASE
ncbi:FHA domain-containing protein [Teredinibacter purpureus]|uniref:FHA domain-containing protein n=1 Tax=Teredinibacter purpureus TaxID=2731756 RepID=UPI0005F80F37|nr:FHA domain-containing protein [Teredinibacter purpureus]